MALFTLHGCSHISSKFQHKHPLGACKCEAINKPFYVVLCRSAWRPVGLTWLALTSFFSQNLQSLGGGAHKCDLITSFFLPSLLVCGTKFVLLVCLHLSGLVDGSSGSIQEVEPPATCQRSLLLLHLLLLRCPFCLSAEGDSDGAGWLRRLLPPLRTLMSFDGAAAFVSLSPSPSPSFFQLLFFLFPSTESCFCRLSSLYVRDRHTSCSLCVRLVHVCAHAPAPACVCVCVCLCVYVCLSTSVE